MKKVTMYETSDYRYFTTEEEAEKHERKESLKVWYLNSVLTTDYHSTSVISWNSFFYWAARNKEKLKELIEFLDDE